MWVFLIVCVCVCQLWVLKKKRVAGYQSGCMIALCPTNATMGADNAGGAWVAAMHNCV